MVGYPGSGKTTASRIISELTGAVHIWADQERGKMFPEVTHSHEESQKLYNTLNQRVEQLLTEGQSVIFDTNFSFYKDRQHLRDIAASTGAIVRLIWVQTDKNLARERATHITHSYQNGYTATMPIAEFERMAKNLQPPDGDEQPIILDGTKITREYVANKLGLEAHEPAA
jgi:predicted kinase